MVAQNVTMAVLLPRSVSQQFSSTPVTMVTHLELCCVTSLMVPLTPKVNGSSPPFTLPHLGLGGLEVRSVQRDPYSGLTPKIYPRILFTGGGGEKLLWSLVY